MSSDAQRAALFAAPVIARSGTMPGAADLAAGAGIPLSGAPARASRSDGAPVTVRRARPGRRSTQPQVDEEAVARKYVHLKWPAGGCAREYHVSPARIRAILAARGVELRPAAAPLDPGAVLAASARHGSVRYAASALGADEHHVRAILDQQGVPRSGPLKVADLSAATRVGGTADRTLTEGSLMCSMTATRTQTVPHPDPQPGPATWPLHASLELGALPTTPGCGRTWARQILHEWRLAPLTGSAELIASELLTNAVLASRGLDRPAILLSLLSDRTRLVILVRDCHPAAPAPRHAGEDDEDGRGLMLVEGISDQFGWYRPADGTPGKAVWALLEAGSRSSGLA